MSWVEDVERVEVEKAVESEEAVLRDFRRFILSHKGRTVIRWAGGDYYLKDEIIAMLCRVPLRYAKLVEVFGGSGVVSQYAPRSKFRNIVYNDIDERLTTLYKLVRDDPDTLFSILSLLPFSREIVRILYENRNIGGVLGAVVLFYLANTLYEGGLVGRGVSSRPDGERSRARELWGHVSAIYDAAKRWRDIYIECGDFEAVIERHDGPETVFYLDPPYVRSSTRYEPRFTHADVARLIRLLNSVRGFYLLKLDPREAVLYEPRLCYRSKRELEYKVSVPSNENTGKLVFYANYELNNGVLQLDNPLAF